MFNEIALIAIFEVSEIILMFGTYKLSGGKVLRCTTTLLNHEVMRARDMYN